MFLSMTENTVVAEGSSMEVRAILDNTSSDSIESTAKTLKLVTKIFSAFIQ